MCSNKPTLVNTIILKDSIVVHSRKYNISKIRWHYHKIPYGYDSKSELVSTIRLIDNITKCKFKPTHFHNITDVESNIIYKSHVNTDINIPYGNGFNVPL